MSELCTSCLLSMGQLLKVLWMRIMASVRGEGCSHLIVVSGTKINHDMFIPGWVGSGPVYNGNGMVDAHR